jgi:hypothetical protein
MMKWIIDILKDVSNNLSELKDIIITKFEENNNINISQILDKYIGKKINEKELNEKEKLNENNKKKIIIMEINTMIFIQSIKMIFPN